MLDGERSTSTSLVAQNGHCNHYNAVPQIEDGLADIDNDSIYTDHNSAATAKLIGRILLLTTAFLYGTLNVTLRMVYALPDPPSASALSTARGWLAALCFIPFLLHRPKANTNSIATPSSQVSAEPSSRSSSSSTLWCKSLELAVFNFLAQGLVNLGLLSVPSARAAFLTQTSVVMTPIISFLAGHAVHKTAWMACGIAMSGLAMLSYDGSGVGHFGLGDILCLTGALSWSMYIFRLSTCQGYNEIHLQAFKTLFLAFLYNLWFGFASYRSETSLWIGYTNIFAWVLLFYSALGPGTVADILQNKGQLTVSAAEGNVILSMEPVFTTLLGLVFLHEALSLQELIGGALIITAAVLATW
jgi:drug/metabolite transporter (DMT)-like permease